MTEPTVRYPTNWPADLDARESWWDDDLTRDQKYEIIDGLAEPDMRGMPRGHASVLCSALAVGFSLWAAGFCWLMGWL